MTFAAHVVVLAHSRAVIHNARPKILEATYSGLQRSFGRAVKFYGHRLSLTVR